MTHIDKDEGLVVTPGDPFYVGYDEFVFHHDDARVILERGHIVVDGKPHRAVKVADCNGYPQLRILDGDFHPPPVRSKA